jgi:hypothetical protein
MFDNKLTMNKVPSLEFVKNAQKPNAWALSNQILYNLCSKYFSHKSDEEIVAKTLMIGRIYAVALERRRNKSIEDISDDFYLTTITRCFRHSQIDSVLSELKTHKELSIEILPEVLKAHTFLTELIHSFTKLKKRSFSSKYLHFHLPHLFFIYDARAVESLRSLVTEIPSYLKIIKGMPDVDKEYCQFVCKCFALQTLIEKEYGINLSTRELDNLLIEIANKNYSHSIKYSNL